MQLSEKEKEAIRVICQNELVVFSGFVNSKYKPSWLHREIAKQLERVEKGEVKRLMLFVPPRHGKQLSNDTQVLTEKGWKNHGDLIVGDKVLSDNGKFVKVLGIGEKNTQNVRVWFSGGIYIDCHENHEWKVYDRSLKRFRILETKNIEKLDYYSGNRCRFQVDYIKPIEGNNEKLQVNPYLLGVWLGDGKSSSGSICFHKRDREHIERIKKLGYELGDEWGDELKNITVYGLRTRLRRLKLLNNKHIPFRYLIAKEEKRRELLRGLIDTDGCVGKDNRVRFVNINKRLINDIKILIESLGYRTCVTSQKACVSSSGVNGKSEVYTISFSPTDGNFFGYIKRKSSKIKAHKKLRGIVKIERIDESEGNCIEVEGGIYCVTENLIPTHNSQLASIDFPAWYLGRHPEKEIITSSYSAELAQDFGYKTRNLVATQEYEELFQTKLRDDSKSKSKWLTKEGGGYTAVGVGGAITGRGADVLIIDDPVKNREEAESKVVRDKIWNWYTSTAYTRLEKDAAVILIMTRWHMDDLAGRLLTAQDSGGDKWEVVKFPAIATEDEQYRLAESPLWAEKYTLSNLQAIKKTVGTYDWSSLYQQEPILSETQEFKPKFYQYRTLEQVRALDTTNYLTIDTAISQKDSADNNGYCLNFIDKENKWNIKAWKAKESPTQLIENLFSLQENFNLVSIGIEETIYLQVVKPFLDEEMRKRNKFLSITPLKHNQTQKETRIRAIIPRYESFSVFHIEGHCDDLEDEQAQFPKGVHDDVLDAEAYQIQNMRPVEKPTLIRPQIKSYI